MGAKGVKDNGAGYLREAREWLVDLGSLYHGTAALALEPSARVGIWQVRATFEPAAHLGTGIGRQSYTEEWPNSREQTFEGFLFTMVLRFNRQCEIAAEVAGLPF